MLAKSLPPPNPELRKQVIRIYKGLLDQFQPLALGLTLDPRAPEHRQGLPSRVLLLPAAAPSSLHGQRPPTRRGRHPRRHCASRLCMERCSSPLLPSPSHCLLPIRVTHCECLFQCVCLSTDSLRIAEIAALYVYFGFLFRSETRLLSRISLFAIMHAAPLFASCVHPRLTPSLIFVCPSSCNLLADIRSRNGSCCRQQRRRSSLLTDTCPTLLSILGIWRGPGHGDLSPAEPPTPHYDGK